LPRKNATQSGTTISPNPPHGGPADTDVTKWIEKQEARRVGGSGVIETFPLPLSQPEQAQLRDSARVIRKALDELEASN